MEHQSCLLSNLSSLCILASRQEDNLSITEEITDPNHYEKEHLFLQDGAEREMCGTSLGTPLLSMALKGYMQQPSKRRFCLPDIPTSH